MKYHFFALNILLFICLLIACDNSPKQLDNTKNTQKILYPSKPKKQTIPTVEFDNLSIQNLIEQDKITLDWSAREIIIRFDKENQTLMGMRARRNKYFNNKGDVVAVVKKNAQGLEIFDTQDKLLWKVLITDKLSIADNEKMRNAFEIQVFKNSTYKVFAPEKTLGDVFLKNNVLLAKGTKQYEINTKQNHPAFGVLHLQNIPEDLRLILVMELLLW
jgi:hypothetical protein